MTRDRALEIIAAYGADAARWPDDERAAASALIAADPGLARERAAAAGLDDLLDAWAVATPARLVVAAPPVRLARRVWLTTGAAMAAAIAGALLLSPGQMATAPSAAPVVVALDPASEDAQTFALLFTPTPDEEDLI